MGRNEVILAKLRDEDFLFNPAFLKSRTPDLSCLPAFDIKLQWTHSKTFRAQELCERGGGRPGLPVPNSPYNWSLWTESNTELELHIVSELRSCVKIEVAVQCSPYLTACTVSVDVKHH